MGYSIDSLTEDCYEGTTCLINKFDIRDDKKLSTIEAIITSAKCSELETHPIDGGFDFSHYLSIHKYIFEDIYTWAGEIRKVSISKKGTNFVSPELISDLAINVFSSIPNADLANCGCDKFVDFIADFYDKTNLLHPFREGNGRTQRMFLTQLIRHFGYNINFSQIDTDELMIATIQAANGVRDNLVDIFRKAIILPVDKQ
ncbi:MAG: Fic family protein [Saccharofermentans sp.]|nr:Fic family protein [Saccharofermentans sp.]